jgi:plastocyanin
MIEIRAEDRQVPYRRGTFMKVRESVLTLALGVVLSSTAYAQHTVEQKDKLFMPDDLTIKVGDSVTFTNDDPFFHNVFSMSEAKTFDLGNFPSGESRTVTFDTAGIIDIECTIHPLMNMTITVEE